MEALLDAIGHALKREFTTEEGLTDFATVLLIMLPIVAYAVVTALEHIAEIFGPYFVYGLDRLFDLFYGIMDRPIGRLERPRASARREPPFKFAVLGAVVMILSLQILHSVHPKRHHHRPHGNKQGQPHGKGKGAGKPGHAPKPGRTP